MWFWSVLADFVSQVTSQVLISCTNQYADYICTDYKWDNGVFFYFDNFYHIIKLTFLVSHLDRKMSHLEDKHQTLGLHSPFTDTEKLQILVLHRITSRSLLWDQVGRDWLISVCYLPFLRSSCFRNKIVRQSWRPFRKETWLNHHC